MATVGRNSDGNNSTFEVFTIPMAVSHARAVAAPEHLLSYVQ